MERGEKKMEYMVFWQEWVYDAFDDLENITEGESFELEADSLEVAKDLARKEASTRLYKIRKEGGFLSHGTFIAQITNLLDRDGMHYCINKRKKIERDVVVDEECSTQRKISDATSFTHTKLSISTTHLSFSSKGDGYLWEGGSRIFIVNAEQDKYIVEMKRSSDTEAKINHFWDDDDDRTFGDSARAFTHFCLKWMKENCLDADKKLLIKGMVSPEPYKHEETERWAQYERESLARIGYQPA